MTEQEAIQVIRELISGDQSIFVQLALKRGLDPAAMARLEAAMRYLATVYRDRDHVPKTVAGAFVDISRDFERHLRLYPRAEQIKIENARDLTVSLAYDLFGVS